MLQAPNEKTDAWFTQFTVPSKLYSGRATVMILYHPRSHALKSQGGISPSLFSISHMGLSSVCFSRFHGNFILFFSPAYFRTIHRSPYFPPSSPYCSAGRGHKVSGIKREGCLLACWLDLAPFDTVISHETFCRGKE